MSITRGREGASGRSLVLVAAAVALFSLGQGGCSSQVHEQPHLAVYAKPVSQSGTTMYTKAKEQYGKLRLKDARGAELAKGMDAVLVLLDGAKVNDPTCPLFPSKEADLCIEMGREGYERARLQYEMAKQLCTEWVPAHIGLGEIAILNGDFPRATQHLRDAESCLHVLQSRTDGQGGTGPRLGTFMVSGLNAGPMPDQVDDPKLPEGQRLRLVLNWLQEGEQWTIENAPIVANTGDKLTMATPAQENLFRRLRARIEFQRVMIEKASQAPPRAVAISLQRVLDWDADYFPARFEKAIQLALDGDYQAAERLLVPYVESTNPALKNNAALAYELAKIYAAWFKVQPTPELAAHADDYFNRLHDLNPEHAPGWVDRAEFYAVAARQLSRPDTIRTAGQCLDRAMQFGYSNQQRIAQVRAAIADARKPIPATMPTGGVRP